MFLKILLSLIKITSVFLFFSIYLDVFAQNEKILLKISIPSKEGSSNAKVIDNFEQELDKGSPGTFKIEKLLLGKGALPQGTEYDALREGKINMAFLSPSDLYKAMRTYEKKLFLSEVEKETFEDAVVLQMLPFLMRNRGHMEKVLKVLNTLMTPGMGALGIMNLGTFYHGRRVLSSAFSTSVRKPEQIIKLRMPEGELWGMVARSLGSPSFLKLGREEVGQAVKRGDIKAMDIPLASFEESGLFGFFSQIIETNHLFHYLYFVIDKDIWNNMTQNQQNIVKVAAREAIKVNNLQRVEKEETLIQDYKRQKIVISHAELDLKAFENLAKEVFAVYFKRYSFKNLYQTIKML